MTGSSAGPWEVPARDRGRLLIHGGRLVDPSCGVDAQLDVRIEDGVVVEVGAGLAADGAARLDATGQIVAPGFIELRAHLGEPGLEHRETFASGLRAAAAGGFTAVVAQPDTQPIADARSVIDMLRTADRDLGGSRLLPAAALSRDLAGEQLTELGELSDAGAVWVTDGPHSIRSAALLRRALLYARHFGLRVAHRALDADLVDEGVMHEGEFSTRLGLPGSPALAEDTLVARDLLIAEETGGRHHLAPVTTAGAVAKLRDAKSRGVDVTADTTPAHLLLTDEAVALRGFATALRLDPPLRAPADVEALLAAVADGTIDALAGDHRPHHADEKDVQWSVAPPGASALETTVGVCLDRLVRAGLMSLSRLVELLSSGPARVLGENRLAATARAGRDGAPPAGTLVEGALGDATLLDLDHVWTVDSSRFASFGRATPFDGWRLQGRAVATVVGGRPAWQLEPGRFTPADGAAS
ncbi:MAG: dihydroorotase [Acidobacteriota bacterium]